ncbi:hypothetical protein XI09_02705 [Bradyrhizobium sp. CCBAU 11386]|nr:hypothetical protein [Bradyrhizobium sp. CCBAU 11386]
MLPRRSLLSDIVIAMSFTEPLGRSIVPRPRLFLAVTPAAGAAALQRGWKNGKLTCERLLTRSFERSLLSGRHGHLFQRTKKGPAFFRYDPLSGFSRNQLLSENIEIRGPLCQSLHTSRPLRAAGVEYRQVILQDSETRTALRLAGENLKYRELKTHIR